MGAVQVPGDKSISIRALIIGALALGTTRIAGLLEARDVMATAGALGSLGARIERLGPGLYEIEGVGGKGLREPSGNLDLENSGTGARLLMGVLAGQAIEATITGDASLSSRPMDRVMKPLQGFGARFSCRDGHFLPVAVSGLQQPVSQTVILEVPSAQVKSAILLAGLNASGTTEIREPWPTRDHTERMLAAFGANIQIEKLSDGSRSIRLEGGAPLRGVEVQVPGDISSAAFFLVAASIVPGSELRLTMVGLNPTRSGLLEVLAQMGADIQVENRRDVCGEPVADLVVRSAPLTGVAPDPALAPRLIDEFPVLFAAAACACGKSVFRGLGELRLKESDRITAMARGLAACGVAVEEHEDGLSIDGTGMPPKGGATVAVELDHRIAMSFLVLGSAAAEPVTVDDIGPVATSFPDFVPMMNKIGALMAESDNPPG